MPRYLLARLKGQLAFLLSLPSLILTHAASQHCPLYGGLAVIEGVMMKGREHLGLALKGPEEEELVLRRRLGKRFPPWVYRAPLLRGIFILYDMLTHGFWAINRSAEYYSEAHLGEKLTEAEKKASWVGVVISLVIFLAVFKVLPSLIAGWLALLIPALDSLVAKNLVEGAIRLGLFLGYVAFLWRFEEFRRVFQYHGAEHTVINAFEQEPERYQEMEVLRRHSRIHPRCGTSFVVYFIVFAILIYTLADYLLLAPTQAWGLTAAGATWPVWWIRALVRVVGIIPLVMVSYEVIRNIYPLRRILLLRPLVDFGMLFQYLTTAPPREPMLDAGLKALNVVRVVEEKVEPDRLVLPERVEELA